MTVPHTPQPESGPAPTPASVSASEPAVPAALGRFKLPTPQQALKQYFGYDSFRPNQGPIVEALLAGRDVLAVMPTGAGKSICYQVPAVCAGGWTLVVSPLISLMKDQVNALSQAGIPAAFVNSALTPAQQRETLDAAARGAYSLLYVSPERLQMDSFATFAQENPPRIAAIDEAHCISQWGQDFRPSYTGIAGFLDRLPQRPPVAAFTATATRRVRDDIAASLALNDPLRVLASFDRPNLHFAVYRPATGKQTDALLKRLVGERLGQAGIVYCTTQKAVETVCDDLRAWGFSATRYHGGLGVRERRENQDDFINDRADVMVATNAFGMGIDKSNVSFVIHYNLPLDVESYYQEAGRAGRDGEPADCILIYRPKDVRTCEFLIDAGCEQRPGIDGSTAQNLRAQAKERLKRMTFYATTNDCLRGYLLRYFGETAPLYCGNCLNCETAFEERDVTVDAQMVASCVARLAQRNRTLGRAMIVDILRGSKSDKVVLGGYEDMSTYGLMRERSAHQVRFMLDALIEQGILGVQAEPYPVVVFTARTGEFLRNREPLVLKVPKETDAERTRRKAARDFDGERVDPVDQALFQRLKELRAQIAASEGVPAYIVFTDKTLTDMCHRLPATEDELLEVSGVGRAKAGKYGDLFLHAIADYRSEAAAGQ